MNDEILAIVSIVIVSIMFAIMIHSMMNWFKSVVKLAVMEVAVEMLSILHKSIEVHTKEKKEEGSSEE